MNSSTQKLYGIAVFHHIGDALACTPIVHQLKADDPTCHVKWFTSKAASVSLLNNPYIDELIILDGDPYELDAAIPQLKLLERWTRFFTPGAYMNYDAYPAGSILDPIPKGTIFGTIKTGARLNWTVPFVFSFRLTEEEKKQAQNWWKSLPAGKKILVETDYRSEQSPWNEDYLLDMLNALRILNPVFVFTSQHQPEFLQKFSQIYPLAFWCNQPFRLNAEFFNLADAFIGVSSGISCLSYSDYCQTNKPHIEVTRGEHWGAAELPQHSDLSLCYTRKRFQEALSAMAAKLAGNKTEADFSVRFPQATVIQGSSINLNCCPVCGSPQLVMHGKGEEVNCKDCKVLFNPIFLAGAPCEEVRVQGAAPTNSQATTISAARRLAIDEAIYIHGNIDSGSSLLEIQCGWGESLDYAKQIGLNACGYETKIEEQRFASNHLRLNVKNEDFIKAQVPGSSFDLVILYHVIEQSSWPFELLEKAQHVLKPDGLIQCVFSNAESSLRNMLGESWTLIPAKSKRYQFNAKCLREMLIQAGFYVESCKSAAGAFGRENVIRALQQLNPTRPAEWVQNYLYELESRLVGEEIRIVARKRGASSMRVKPYAAVFKPFPEDSQFAITTP